MLTSATNSSSSQRQQQQQQQATTNLVPSPSNSIKNIKSEPYVTLSPSLDDCSNKNTKNNNNNNNNNMTMDVGTTAANTSSSSSSSSVVATSIMRQNSNSSVNSGNNASPPNNASDHSNSSNLSTNLVSQTTDASVAANTTETLQDLNNEKTNKKKALNANIKEEEHDKPNSISSKNTLNLLTTVKEEPDVLDCLASVVVKKEEHTLSPNMSPVGFGSIGNVDNGGRGTPVKLIDSIKSDTLIAGSGDDGGGICNITGINNNSPNDNSGVGTGSVGNLQQASLNNFNNNNNNNNNNNSNSGGSIGNCMDYMEQQNHISSENNLRFCCPCPYKVFFI